MVLGNIKNDELIIHEKFVDGFLNGDISIINNIAPTTRRVRFTPDSFVKLLDLEVKEGPGVAVAHIIIIVDKISCHLKCSRIKAVPYFKAFEKIQTEDTLSFEFNFLDDKERTKFMAFLYNFVGTFVLSELKEYKQCTYNLLFVLS